MPPIKLPPTSIDHAIASVAARYTNPQIQGIARAATWAGDHHVLLGLASAAWLLSRNHRKQKVLAEHVFGSILVSNLIAKQAKKFVDQQRPDRCEVANTQNGIGKSGNAADSFPSGHSAHLGALVSAATWIFPQHRSAIRLASGTIALTRIAVLAHWASDVVVGWTLGAAVEHALRPITKSRLSR